MQINRIKGPNTTVRFGALGGAILIVSACIVWAVGGSRKFTDPQRANQPLGICPKRNRDPRVTGRKCALFAKC